MARRVINRGQGCNLKEQKNNSPPKQFLDKQKGGMAEDKEEEEEAQPGWIHHFYRDKEKTTSFF